MKTYLVWIPAFILFACNGSDQAEKTTTNEDTVELTTSYCDLPVVDEFYLLDDSVFNVVPVYDRGQISDLICKGSRAVSPNGEDVWDLFATYDNDRNIRMDHTSSLSSIQFGVFERAGKLFSAPVTDGRFGDCDKVL